MTLGTQIQSRRGHLGLSQEKLAEQLGISRQAVSKWETGDALPDTDKLVPLARALGITVDQLLGNEASQGPSLANQEPSRSEAEREKQPGWFATHWYYLGLIPVVWGCYILAQISILWIAALLAMR